PTGGAPMAGGFKPGAVTGGTLEMRESNNPGEAAGRATPEGPGVKDGAPAAAGFGIPIPGGVRLGAFGATGAATVPTEEGAVTAGEGGMEPGFLIFVGKVKMSFVPGSPFSATAPPPWAARMVFTRANFKPVPANWGEAGCLGS